MCHGTGVQWRGCPRVALGACSKPTAAMLRGPHPVHVCPSGPSDPGPAGAAVHRSCWTVEVQRPFINLLIRARQNNTLVRTNYTAEKSRTENSCDRRCDHFQRKVGIKCSYPPTKQRGKKERTPGTQCIVELHTRGHCAVNTSVHVQTLYCMSCCSIQLVRTSSAKVRR